MIPEQFETFEPPSISLQDNTTGDRLREDVIDIWRVGNQDKKYDSVSKLLNYDARCLDPAQASLNHPGHSLDFTSMPDIYAPANQENPNKQDIDIGQQEQQKEQEQKPQSEELFAKPNEDVSESSEKEAEEYRKNLEQIIAQQVTKETTLPPLRRGEGYFQAVQRANPEMSGQELLAEARRIKNEVYNGETELKVGQELRTVTEEQANAMIKKRVAIAMAEYKSQVGEMDRQVQNFDAEMQRIFDEMPQLSWN